MISAFWPKEVCVWLSPIAVWTISETRSSLFDNIVLILMGKGRKEVSFEEFGRFFPRNSDEGLSLGDIG